MNKPNKPVATEKLVILMKFIMGFHSATILALDIFSGFCCTYGAQCGLAERKAKKTLCHSLVETTFENGAVLVNSDMWLDASSLV